MPPRARGRGRGGRGSASGMQRSANAANKIMKTSPRSARGQQRRIAPGLDHDFSPRRRGGRVAQTNHPHHPHHHHLQDATGTQSIHAIVENGLLIVIGLQPEHFPDYDSEEYENAHDAAEDADSDYASGLPKKSQKQQHGEPRLRVPFKAQHLADDDDPSPETEVEMHVEERSRGVHQLPARREVVRLRLRRDDGSRYNEHVSKDSHSSPLDDKSPGNHLSLETSHASNPADDGLPGLSKKTLAISDVASHVHRVDDEVPGLEHEDLIVEELEEDDDDEEEAEGEGEEPMVELVDEGELSDSNFPGAFLSRLLPSANEDYEDEADVIMKNKFQRMGDSQALVAALTKLDPTTRNLHVLFDIALNAQKALKAWQDEYLELDLRTAPAANPPKKPLTGGRTLLDPLVYEDMLEADLYDYTVDPKKLPGQQDPFRQRNGRSKLVGGRELRHRRARDVGGADLSENEGMLTTGTGNEGYGTRRRRAAQRGDEELRTSSRGTKRPATYGAIEQDGPPRKRGRQNATDKPDLQSRIRQLREESLAVSIASSDVDGQSPEPPKRRGRPPGSKNTAPRSDAGIKKGPRKARLNVEYADTEVLSQNGGSERRDTATPVSHPSGDDAMIVDDDIPKITVNDQDMEMADRPQADSVIQSTEPPAVKITTVKDDNDDDEGPEKDPKKRVRSEKRSKSMTEWWAARKAKAAEDRRVQLAQQAEADRLADEQARAAHAMRQNHQPLNESRYWSQVSSQQLHHHHHPPPPPPLAPPPQQQQQEEQQQQQQQAPPPPPAIQYGPPPTQERQHGLPAHDGRLREYYLHAPAPLGMPGGQQLVHPQHVQPQPPPVSMQMQSPQLQARQPPQEASQIAHHPIPAPPRPPLQPLHTQQLPPSSAMSPYGGSPIDQQSQQSYHHHGAPTQQPYGAPSYQQPPPPPPPQFSPTLQSQQASRQPSPLKRIVNYVSDPTRAAQPAGPPYQTIMTPGSSGSPNQPYFPGPIFRTGRTPPTVASSIAPISSAAPDEMMTAFQVDNPTNGSGKRTHLRMPLPGTASWRSDNPGRKPFAAQGPALAPHKVRGRMTGGEVQDLALAAIQPVKRRPMHDVIREKEQREQQRELRDREMGVPNAQQQQERERDGPRPLMRLQPAPPPQHVPLPPVHIAQPNGPPPPQPTNGPPTVPPQQKNHESWYDTRHVQRMQQPPPPLPLPPQMHHHHQPGPPVDPNLPPPVGPPRFHSHHQHQPSYPPPHQHQSHLLQQPQSQPYQPQQQQHYHQQHHAYNPSSSSSSMGLPALAPAAERPPQPPRLPPYQDMAQGLGPSLAPAPPSHSNQDRGDNSGAAPLSVSGRARSISAASLNAHPHLIHGASTGNATGVGAGRDVNGAHMRFVEMLHGEAPRGSTGSSGGGAGGHGHGHS